MSKNAWIYQANPKLYKLDIKLKEDHGQSVIWKSSNFFDEIQSGDRVYFWQASGGKPHLSGFYGWGRVESVPFMDQGNKKIKLIYEGMFKPFIPKTEILNDSNLNGMTILRSPMGVNFRLSNQEATTLGKLVKKDGNWNLKQIRDMEAPLKDDEGALVSLETFKRVIARTTKLKLDQLGKVLKMHEDELLLWLYELPEDMGFVINDDMIDFDRDKIQDEIDKLIEQYDKFDLTKEGKM